MYTLTWVRVSTLAVFFVLHGCSQPPLPEERIRAYWDAVKDSDWATAWEMEYDALTDGENPFDYYQRMRKRFRIVGLELSEPTIDGDTAVLRVETQRALPFGGGRYARTERYEDRWRYADGAWWHSETVRVRPTESEQDPLEAGESEVDKSGEEPGSIGDGVQGETSLAPAPSLR